MTKSSPIDRWKKLPEIEFPMIYDVHDVGFICVSVLECNKRAPRGALTLNGNYVLPAADVQLGDHIELRKLPLDMTSWIADQIMLAQQGFDEFPAKVEFGKRNGKAFAKILTEHTWH